MNDPNDSNDSNGPNVSAQFQCIVLRRVERLSAAERDIRDARVDDAVRERQRLVAVELVGPALVGAGLLAAREAARVAAIGELPRKKERRAVFVYRAAGKRGQLSHVKRM